MSLSEVSLVFPHQLFDPHPALRKGRPVWLVEDSLLFGDDRYPAAFHQKKLVLLRAGMKGFQARLEKRGYDVRYVEYEKGKRLGEVLGALRGATVHVCDPVDFMLEKRLRNWAEVNEATVRTHETPMFVSPQEWIDEVLGKREKKFLMADFYAKQRVRMGILLEDDASPVGGKWSFDTENRKKLPKGLEVPGEPGENRSKLVLEAIGYVGERFGSNPGSGKGFVYPVTHEAAAEWLERFLEERLEDFGAYEDAMSLGHTRMFHGMLTPMMNIGLLTPQQVMERTMEVAGEREIPLNSLEGFIRQVIGWREFMRALYGRIGVRQRTANFWGFERELPESFYTGETGLEPVDHVIRRVLETGYCHHIERLMVLGNIMCLCRFHPDAVYRWFMELFIDAYDWVMVPNVYGMSQFADGGLMTTKPYISGSNYVRKMSDFPKGAWCEVWDGLFWTFIGEHEGFFRGNPRLSMMARQWETMDAGKRRGHEAAAEGFLGSLGA